MHTVLYDVCVLCGMLCSTTFRVSLRRCKTYIGHGLLSACLTMAVFPHYCTDPDVTWGSGKGCLVVVHIGRICKWCMGFVAMTT